MPVSTVAVTGGNGKIGRATLAHLNDQGYETANISRGERREEVSDTYITTDLLDAGETYGAIAKTGADAVIHMGTIPDPYRSPQFRTYESNTMSAVHVLEASESLGLEACCLASSINAMGSDHQKRDPYVEYLPVDENHPRTPDDIYGIAKHAMEITADGFGRRPDSSLTISTLRYPWVANETEIRERFAEADRSMQALRDNGVPGGYNALFSYLHIDDAATVARKAIEADYVGHESFWTVASDTTMSVPTEILTAEFFPQSECRTEFEGHEAMINLSKAERLLNWTPNHSWRNY